jgi:hypothetical protein
MKTLVIPLTILALLISANVAADETAVEAVLRSIGIERRDQAAFLEFCHCTTPTAPSFDRVVKSMHEGFRAAKNKEEAESVRLYCAASIASHSFSERDRLNVKALELLRSNRIDEGNYTLNNAKSLSELDGNLAKMTCKPDSEDEYYIRSHNNN